MNILSITTIIILLLIGVYAISKDIKLSKRIMLNSPSDKTLKEDLEELINKKTRLYFTASEIESGKINPFATKIEKIKI